MIETRCPHCNYRLTGFTHELARSGHASHIRRCERASPEERAYFLAHGFWRLKPGSRRTLTVVRPEVVEPRIRRPRLPGWRRPSP